MKHEKKGKSHKIRRNERTARAFLNGNKIPKEVQRRHERMRLLMGAG